MKILKFSLFLTLLTTVFFSCQKEYSVETILTAAGTWQFNDSSKLYTGNIDSAYVSLTGTTKTMNLLGRSTDGKQNFVLHLTATDSFTLREYKASLYQSDFEYFTQGKTIYQADQFIGEFIVTLTALSSTNVSGTFAGISEDSTGALKPLTLGKFTSRINLTGNVTGGGSGTATGTLGVSAGACTSFSSSGVYTQGVSLTSSNTATVQVTVATPGSYTISTNTVNGVTFSKTGIFTAAGPQSVILVGSGTPVSSGNQTFAVSFGTSTCNFSITFGAGTPPLSDYFPTTPGSFWVYALQGGTSADSLQIKVLPSTITFASNTYSIFTYDGIPASTNPDSLYFRKSSGLYYEYFNTQSFFGFNSPGTPPNLEYPFLKDTASVGIPWQSQSVTGTYTGPPPATATFYIKMTVLAKAVPVTIGTFQFPDVIKVKYEYFASPSTLVATEQRWFARAVGLIYNSDDFSGPTEVFNIARYKIN